MLIRNDIFIHDLAAELIQGIIKNDAWKTNNQSISSAITNQDNIEAPDDHYLEIGENTSGPTAFVDIHFSPHVKRVLDVGGGQFDCNKNYLKKSKNIDLFIWDPFNRSQEHNLEVFSAFSVEKADAVTSMSVLNVIPELESRLAHITTLKSALKSEGKAYIKIWPGELPYKGSYIPTSTCSVYQANAKADRFLREIETVFGVGNVTLDKHVENLIVAVKKSDALTSLMEIKSIQLKSQQDMVESDKFKKKALKKINQETSVMKLLQFNLSLFNRSVEFYLQDKRHLDPTIQHEYDKRYGISIHRN